MDTSQIYEATAENNHDNKKPILVRPNKEQALNCPRCNSTNTKFCYYNNYSLSQPRYLCKTCKRYWTEGGNLRNVPVGGGSRKNKRSSSSSNPPSTSSKKAIIPNLSPLRITPQNPKTHHLETLNLDFNPAASSICHGMSEFGVFPFGLNFKNLNPHQNPNFCSSGVSNNIGYTTTSLISLPAPANPNPNSVFSSSSFDGFKPSLSFSLDHHGYGNNHLEAGQENPIATSSRLAGLPFDQGLIKPFSTTTNIDHHQFDHHGKGQGGSNGYWHEMIDGGSW